ncbi:MAG: hypothetical protein GQ574_13975 [Crocinitomix sp.]|nr:hypothetical protein [Crocinitomix sp.]
MKANKMKFSKRTILLFISINWIAMIVLTCYFLGEKNATSMAIVGTLFIGFILQLGFLSDQLKIKKKQ